MSSFESELDKLRITTQAWLKRPLTATEEQLLRQQLHTKGQGSDPSGPMSLNDVKALGRMPLSSANPDPSQNDSAMRDILRKLQSTTAQALQSQEREAQAINNLLDAARTLNDLRPSSAMSAPPTADADRLAELIRAEVQKAFDQQLKPLQRRLEEALGALQKAQGSDTPTE